MALDKLLVSSFPRAECFSAGQTVERIKTAGWALHKACGWERSQIFLRASLCWLSLVEGVSAFQQFGDFLYVKTVRNYTLLIELPCCGYVIKFRNDRVLEFCYRDYSLACLVSLWYLALPISSVFSACCICFTVGSTTAEASWCYRKHIQNIELWKVSFQKAKHIWLWVWVLVFHKSFCYILGK